MPNWKCLENLFKDIVNNGIISWFHSINEVILLLVLKIRKTGVVSEKKRLEKLWRFVFPLFDLTMMSTLTESQSNRVQLN